LRLLFGSAIAVNILFYFLIQWLFIGTYIIFLLSIAGFFYYRKKGLIIHTIDSEYIYLSIPDGKYAEDFGFLNGCTTLKGCIFTQD